MTEGRSENGSLVERLSAIHLQPGDVVWVQTPELSMEAIDRLRSMMRDAFPGHQVVVTPPGYDISAFSGGAESGRRPCSHPRFFVPEDGIRRCALCHVEVPPKADQSGRSGGSHE